MSNENMLKKSVLSSLIWKFLEQGGVALLTLVINIVLARILTPADYGVVGLISVFIAVSNVFANGGFGSALVQKKDGKEIDYYSVFWTSLVISIICYIILFFLAPFIADFYHEPILVKILRIQSLSLIFTVYTAVTTAKFQKELKFKSLFKRTLISLILSGVISIFMAIKGFGVWAIVGQNISYSLFNVIVFLVSEKWIPKLQFSFERVKSLFSFGYKLLISNLIDTVYNNIYSLVIGKVYTKSDLGYYNKGKNFPNMIIQNLNTSIQSVLLPVMSKSQDDREQLKMMVRRSITVSCFIIFPAMAGLAGISTPLIKLLLTEKWLPCIPFLCFCCFTYALWPIHTANLQAINAMGRSDIFLKLEIIKKAINITGLIVSIPYGIIAMMWVRTLTSALGIFINGYPNKKLLNYRPLEQIRDILPYALLSLIMCGTVLSINLLKLNSIITMIIQIVVGVVIYVLGAKLFKLEAFEYVLNITKGFLKKRKS